MSDFDWSKGAEPEEEFDWGRGAEPETPKRGGTVPPRSQRPKRTMGPTSKDPGYLSTVGHNLLSGFFKGGSDELVGAITDARIDADKGDVAWRDEKGIPRLLRTEGDVYRAGRDAERRTLDAGSEHNPKTAFVSGMAGDMASDALLNLVGVPVNSRPYQIATSALSGFLNSDADLTPDKATSGGLASAGLSAAGSALVSALLPDFSKKTGGGGVTKYIGQKLSKAQGEIDQAAAENLIKTARSLGSDLGNESKRAHTAMRELEEKAMQGRLMPDEHALHEQMKATPEMFALDRSIVGNSLENLTKAPVRVGMARDAVNELKKNAPELLEGLKDQYGNHPFKRTILPFLARYGAPIAGAIASGVGAGTATNSAIGAIGGAIAGGLATNRYVRKGAKNTLGRGADEVAEALGHEVPDVAQKIKDRIASKYKDSLGKVGGQDAISSDVGSALLSALMGGAKEVVTESAGAGARPAIRAAQRLGVAPDVRKMYWSALGSAAKKLGDPLAQYGTLLTQTAQRQGIDAAVALEYALSKADPEYARQKEERMRSLQDGDQ